MKVVTIGMSPYNTSSVSRIHRWILESLFFAGHDVLSLSWAHDISYYIPDDNGHFTYKFEGTPPGGNRPVGPQEYAIPILPLKKALSDPIPIYEALNQLEPDVVITIGELIEAGVMKAVKTFTSKPFKWLSVLTQSQFPLNDELVELFDYTDGVLCSSSVGHVEAGKFFKNKYIDHYFVGSDDRFHAPSNRDPSKFRIMTLGKVIQADNLPMVMEACAKIRSSIPNLELYVHANIHDNGEYQMELLRARFDPEDEFIRFPEKFVSLVDGIPDADLAAEYAKSDVFVSTPLVAGTGMSVFESMGCGCLPLMSDCPVNRDIATKIENELGEPEIRRGDLLIPGIQLMTTGETYLTVSNPAIMAEKLLMTYKNREKLEGHRDRLAVFSQKNSKQAFVEKLVGMTTTLQTTSEVLCLETL